MAPPLGATRNIQSKCPSVYEIIRVRGSNIVQAGIYRFMLSGADGVGHKVVMNEQIESTY